VKKFPNKNLSFQAKWLQDYKWLLYSEHLKGAFCKFCVLFAKGSSKFGKNQQFGALVLSHHSDWKNARRDYNAH